MAERVQKQKTSNERTDDVAVVADETAVDGARQGERIKADLDDLLDEIDEVLEDNAEEFVKSYIQKGGE